jgi:hypothetical protein
MSRIKMVLVGIGVLLLGLQLQAQRVVYSEPDKDDARTINYEIVGKVAGNYVIYKENRGAHSISVFDNQMQLTEKNTLDFLPDKIMGAEFIGYTDYFYMFYQYQQKNIVYSMVVKLDGKGIKMGDPITVDTSDINYFADNKVYSVINSDDKQKIAVFKINSKNDRNYIVTSFLLDKELKQLRKSVTSIAMPEKNDFLTEFQLSNDGDLVFVRASGTSQNDNINKLSLFTRPAQGDSIFVADIAITGMYLDDIRVKVDNYNKHFLVTSFYSKQRRGNVDGLFCYLWDKNEKKVLVSSAALFSEELRNNARGDNSLKAAFNDYFLRNIIMRRDGGFIIAAEAAYTSSRGGNNFSRWDYLNGSPYWGSPGYSSMYSPYYGSYGYGYPWRNNSFGVTRYYADNIAILCYDVNMKPEWSNVLTKAQYDDNTDNLIGYAMANTGGEMHFLINSQDKRTTILSDQYITADGQIVRNPTLKNLDKGYDFMPRYAKQVGIRQLIVPCQYRNYVCFAKVDL